MGPWYESGFRYLWAAAIETGLYLLIPLTYVALRFRWREHRDGIYALVLLLVVTHMAYLFEIGGDHFEYRPMDFYWPLLAVPAAEAVARLGEGLTAALKRGSRHLRWVGGRTLAVVLFVPLLFYASAIQCVLFVEGAATTKFGQTDHIELDEENFEWLLAAPAMPALVAISNDMRGLSVRHQVGSRFAIHREYADARLRQWQPYLNAERGVLPTDAVMAMSSIGVPPYYFPDLRVIDLLGLTDATIGRNPIAHSNNERSIAHDRWPPAGYLQRQGPSIRLYPAAATEADALTRANYALNVGPEVWMPFDVFDHAWANERFADHDVRAINRYSQTDPAGNRFTKDGVRYVGEEFLGRFDEITSETELDGWRREVKAVTNHAVAPFHDRVIPVRGYVGPGFLTTYYPGKWERTGRAYSPTFVARDDQYLAFLIAGERHERVGMRLLADGEEVAVWRGDRWGYFVMVVYPLREVAGKELQLEILNNEIGDRPRLMLDHVMLVRRE